MNIGQEFQNYYVNHLGKGSLDLHNYSTRIESSMTPYILEDIVKGINLMWVVKKYGTQADHQTWTN